MSASLRRCRSALPDKLAADLILGLSEPGELVLDLLIGSGTSVVIAAKLGRRFLGMDASAQYVEIARQRLAWEVWGEPCNAGGDTQARREVGKALEDTQEAPVGAEGGLDE